MISDIQVKRLKRHYEASIRTYDNVSLLDLSHTLRVWTEMKRDLLGNSKFGSQTAFKSGSPNRKLIRQIGDAQFLLTYLPDGAITYAHENQIASSARTFGDGYIGATVRKNEDGSLEVRSFQFVALALSPDNQKFVDRPRMSRGNFAQWLGAEVARYRLEEPDGSRIESSISREILIRRVANSMDASHPSSSSPRDSENRFDRHLELLSEFSIGGLPLPYFVLLHAARTIIGRLPN